MNVITLDLAGLASRQELHERLKAVFRLPDHYGHNMDALWDCLHGMFTEPTTIALRNLSSVPEELDGTVRVLCRVFSDLEREDPEVTVRIEAGGGETADPTE